MTGIPGFNPTDEQWAKFKQLAIQCAIMFVVGVCSIFFGFKVIVEPQMQSALQAANAATEQVAPAPGVGALSAPYSVSTNPVRVKNSNIDAFTAWNGSDIKLYSDGGSTLKFSVDGATGNVYAAGAFTPTTSLAGNGTAAAPSIGFSSDPDTGIYRVGANQIGVATAGAKILDCNAVTCTVSIPLSAAGITSTNGITGTLATAAQPNITSVGTLPSATITDLTSTNITGTLATAAQPNVTSLGQLTALDVSGAAIVNNATVTSTLTLGGIAVTGGYKYGSATSVGDGGTVAHTLGVTPTACIFIPSTGYTATLTSKDATNFTIGASGTIPTLDWFCGK